MTNQYDFQEVGRLPASDDNVAIATRRVDAGAEINYNSHSFIISHTILEGHRFAIQTIPEGELLLSWGLPFGVAVTDLSPGDYVCNQKILDALAIRDIDFALPSQPNFKDQIAPYILDKDTFQPGTPVLRYDRDRTFLGYQRDGGRGVGTRNYIIIMGTTSQTSGYAKALAARFKEVRTNYENIDGVVAVTHTEGGENATPNNLEMLLRTLAGFTIHPNVGAILAVDYGSEVVTNQMLQHYMIENNYPLQAVRHRFLSIQGGFDASLTAGEVMIKKWLEPVNAMTRTEESLANLKIALQCGGSDAFSGVSGNPLAAYVAKEVIRYGGAANLAETDELIGAEPYVLQNAKDFQTARKFLDTIERFKERVRWHGHTAEANPSGGNNFRGLYNIVIKSIGAAMKRDPEVRLDYVIDYGEQMLAPGYYFMDSPGNDLESIAGQVASGSNMIFFVTGNGSITNFPFVPTIKIVTTTGRYEMLKNDMDVNAGAYQDGTPMDELGQQMLDLTIDVAAGERSVGEKAGHSQVSIWRNWKQTGPVDPETVLSVEAPAGKPIPVRLDVSRSEHTFNAIQTESGYRSDQIGLILPTSLCSGQIAQMIADQLNQKGLGREHGISRYVALAHTEGCGVSGGNSEDIYRRTLIGHLIHPMVALGLPLEHGCEKTHNDYIRHALTEQGIPLERYGWASVQLDGGIDAVIQKVEDWFSESLTSIPIPDRTDVGLEHLRIGLTSSGKVTEEAAQSLAHLTQTIASAGGTVVVPANATFLTSPPYAARLFNDHSQVRNTLSYGQSITESGFHIMETPTDHIVETLTGLGATGVDLMFAHVVGHPLQAHRMIPLIQGTTEETTGAIYEADLDLLPTNENWTPESFSAQMLESILEVASRRYTPKLYGKGNTDFQFTRGLLGISM